MSLILSGTDGLSDVDGTAATPAIRGTDANTGIFFPAADTIAFSEGGAEAMRIDSSGNVGIGTTSPTYKLSVNSSVGINSYDGVSGKGRVVLGDPLDNTGYVGMYRSLASTIGTAGNDLTLGALATIAFTTGAAGFASQTERMRIDSSGNLLVGTTTSLIAGASTTGIAIQNNNSGAYALNINSTSASGNQYFASYASNGTNRAILYYESASGITKFSGQASGTYSDARLKDVTGQTTYGLETVKAIQIHEFIWKRNGVKDFGVIAQELQQIVPEAVEEGSSGEINPQDFSGKEPWRVEYTKLVPVLVKAIQEQQVLIQSLTTRITALETP